MSDRESSTECGARDALSKARLYGILDLGYVAEDAAISAARALIAGGVGILQLRAKGRDAALIRDIGKEVLPLARAAGVPFIINDHVAIAAEIGADGVHLGQDDGLIQEARCALASGAIIGRSTHSLDQARAGAEEGADYLGFGPLFPTPTKAGRPAIGLEYARAASTLPLPVFAIGGINPATLPAVLAAGARRVVVVSALLQAADIALATADILRHIPALETN